MNLRLPKRGDELRLAPLELDDEGLALARIEIGDGDERRRMRVKIRGAVPGDEVIARVESRVRDDLHTRVATIEAPSPDRVAPRCRHAVYHADVPFCGGCTTQALSYDRQLALKAARVKKAFEVASVALEVAPTLPAPTVWGHRHKMELSFAEDPAGEVALGLHPPGYKWEVVSLAECPLLSPAMSAALPAVEAVFRGRGLIAWDPRRSDSFLRNLVVREGKRSDERLIELVTTDVDPVVTATGPRPARDVIDELAAALLDTLGRAGAAATSLLWTAMHAARGTPTRYVTAVLHGKPDLADSLVVRGRAIHLDVDARAFFQPHPRAAEQLVEVVLERLGPARTVLDLYCGTGTLALSVAPFVERVIGVEIVAEAVANARANAAKNALAATFIVGDVGAVVADPAFRDSLAEPPSQGGEGRPRAESSTAIQIDAVLVDPPRAGLSPQALEALTALGAPRIVYISCKPESLGRDLRLLEARGYRPDRPAQPVDLFPHTHHVETVVSLTR